MLGDYYRYKSEIESGKDNDDNVKHAQEAYEKAT